MKHKSLWKISVVTMPHAEDAVSELLFDCFHHQSASYTDTETGVCTVTTYLAKRPDWPLTRKVLTTGLAHIETCGVTIGSGEISIEKVRRENWAESWKRHFKPIEIGDALLVKPSWSKHRPKKNQAVVILDPGLSFGTGQHPTTSFCLKQVVERWFKFQVSSFKSKEDSRRRSKSQLVTLNSQRSFLDIGTGSGILAIAAAKLGYAPVEAFDFDPEAVAVAHANARRNRVSGKMHVDKADITQLPLRGKRFSLVCANLISNLLISEQQRILATVQPGGILVLAGILQTEFVHVQNSYEKAGMQLMTARTENEWRCGAFAWSKTARKNFE